MAIAILFVLIVIFGSGQTYIFGVWDPHTRDFCKGPEVIEGHNTYMSRCAKEWDSLVVS